MRLPLVRRSALKIVLDTLAAVRAELGETAAGLDDEAARAEQAERALDGLRLSLAEAADEVRRAEAGRAHAENGLAVAGDALSAACAERDEALAEVAKRDAPPELTAEEVAWYHQEFKDGKGCATCGGIHARSCPRVRSVEYEARGDKVSIRKVTFWPPGKWDATDIVFSDQLPDPEEESE